METRTERFAAQMMDDADPITGTTRFQFDCDESGDIVLQAQFLSKSYKNKQLFKDVEFTIRQGECIALVGPNGAGKSTFVKTLLGDVASDNPRAVLRFGSRVRVGYYDQELRGVNPENTLIAEMIRMVGDVEAHNLLGRFLFPYDAQYKLIKDLSGGERARLALLKLTLLRCNFLILDEPTNHLDVEMIEALEEALADFAGTLLVISHDRRFIEATTDFIWELKDSHLTMYPGDWSYYQSKRTTSNSQTSAPNAQARTQVQKENNKSPSKWKRRQQLETLEKDIQELEAKLSHVTQQLSNASHLSPLQIAELGKEHSQLEEKLLEQMTLWEETTKGLKS
jgi:ATP-binding cassette subfamily F protein 3